MAKLLAQRGAILSEIADCFGVDTRTLYRVLREAVDAGNDVFNPRVERALAERAIGFWVDMKVWKKDEGKLIEKDERKYFPPDVTACIFFLKNRMPDRWRDVREHGHTDKLKSSDEWLAEIQKDILELQADGYIDLNQPVLAPQKKGNGHVKE
jgi:hypothetical protein